MCVCACVYIYIYIYIYSNKEEKRLNKLLSAMPKFSALRPSSGEQKLTDHIYMCVCVCVGSSFFSVFF